MSNQQVRGSIVIAEALVQLGVRHVFGIVGIPVIEVADALIARGIKFISFRNEQAAAYAASIYGYLTGLPGICLVVGGPGVLHAVAGVGNASANHLPFLLLAGSSETHQIEKGAFQELDQVAYLAPHTKFAARPPSIEAIPTLLEKAYRTAYFGRPGPTYLDLPADFIQGTAAIVRKVSPPGPAPRTAADPERIAQAAALLKDAKSPLLIIGKGAAYAHAEGVIRRFQETVQLPFLPTPMGKGVLPDNSPLNTSAARSAALKSADVILLLGARLNWILHYGEAPKFRPDVKIIQVDISAEELGNNAGSASLGIVGDINLVVTQLHDALKQIGAHNLGSGNGKLPAAIQTIKDRNTEKARVVENNNVVPLKYQPVYRVIREVLARQPRKVIYVSEGANTMDISRSAFPLNEPRTRLDAGTNATMGVGLGYAIAAKAVDPASLVVAIEGDSAFGFSLAEVDTAVRHRLPIIFFVINNSGVYHGVDPTRYEEQDTNPLPATALALDTKYHLLGESFGALGYEVRDLQQLEAAVTDAVKKHQVAVINVIIESGKDKKLEFGWMASTKKAKL
ncbi:hypothetical protein D0Z03_001814 [Geotrichum reessii]|nr:hypothetical protein D0Z03_001814 [Galactomyces reessii]